MFGVGDGLFVVVVDDDCDNYDDEVDDECELFKILILSQCFELKWN